MRRAVLFSGGIAAVIALVLWLLLLAISPEPLPIPPRDDLVIAGVTVINPGVERLGDYSIVVRDGRIAELRPRLDSDPKPICPGCYAVPGLIDAHVHTPPRIAIGNQRLFSLLYLAHGVTTVRDVGASDASIATLAEQLNAGEQVGPRMLRCGPVIDGDPPSWPMAEVVNDSQSGSDLVDRLADSGVDCIKVYNEVSAAAFETIATAARRRQLPLIGHVPHAVGLAGISDFESQHMTGVPYHERPRPPFGWDLRDEDVLLLTTPEIERALEVARRQRVSFTPTLANFRLRLIASDPQRFPATAASKLLPGYWPRAWDLIAGHPTTPQAIESRLRALPALRELVRRAHAMGIEVIAGTDTLMPWVVPGESLHLELAELELALGDAELALATATTVSGRRLDRGDIGVIARGARADILLTPEDPTRQLRALRDWRILLADGRRYDRSVVDTWLESYRRHFRGPLYSALMGSVVNAAIDRFEHADRDAMAKEVGPPGS